jgi:ubiquinone/menaquinone biosynthesis C-methylase UbiE
MADPQLGIHGSVRSDGLNDRQRRERTYHEEFAQRNREKINEPVLLDVIEPGPRRPWNGYWTAYDMLTAENLAGKQVLVPGCGFGEDAIRLAKLGARVSAFDLSPDLVEIARERALKMGVPGINFQVMPAEALAFSDNFFDLIFFNDILHHVDIPRAVSETRRVLKPGGRLVANELYTHSAIQRIRDTRLVSGFIYRRMVRFIYGTDKPYITEDEHKIDEREMAILEAILRKGVAHHYFLVFGGRLLPAHWLGVAKFDSALLSILGPLGRIFAGRVVLAGTVAK